MPRGSADQMQVVASSAGYTTRVAEQRTHHPQLPHSLARRQWLDANQNLARTAYSTCTMTCTVSIYWAELLCRPSHLCRCGNYASAIELLFCCGWTASLSIFLTASTEPVTAFGPAAERRGAVSPCVRCHDKARLPTSAGLLLICIILGFN